MVSDILIAGPDGVEHRELEKGDKHMTEPHPQTASAHPFVAVVTGASSGIGEATARRLARVPNAQLVLVARREERLRALAGSLGPQASFLALDLLDEDAPERVRAHIASTTDASTCSSTTPAPPGAHALPRAATPTSSARWTSTSTPSCV